MPDSNAGDGFFYLPRTPMIDSYIITLPVAMGTLDIRSSPQYMVSGRNKKKNQKKKTEVCKPLNI